MNDFERGFVLGFFASQGSFGGDGKQAHIIFRTSDSHERLLDRLTDLIPGSKINGPYGKPDKRFYQWSLRGSALAEFIDSGILDELAKWDDDAYSRYRSMIDTYFKEGRSRSLKSRRMTSSSGGSSTESD